MSETLVEDGSTYPASVTVPEDGDARNAASVVIGFQALANRCKYLYSKLMPFITGGAASLAASLDYTLTGSSTLRFLGTSAAINLAEPFVTFGGKVLGRLFTAGSPGMANKKTLLVNSGSGSLDVDPELYDTVILVSISGPRSIVLTTSLVGAHIKVVSLNTSYASNLQRPAGGGQIGPDVRYTAGDAFVVEAVCDTTNTWRLTGQCPVTLA